MNIGPRAHWTLLLLALSLLLILPCCGAERKAAPVRYYHRAVKSKGALPRMGYTIQAGAFAKAENAFRFTDVLRARGLAATYFVAKTGLYKVQFGNFPTKQAAREKARKLKETGVIEEYYIVAPEDYAVTKREKLGTRYLREEIVKTAKDFIGVPYLWGGSSADAGFDCSGLTMTVYQLNGLDLPRVSYEQYQYGASLERDDLERGDLVFFANPGGRICHVGVYIGSGAFVHAPGVGKTIRVDRLDSDYYARRFAGGRCYIE
ncbi:MAG: NlpC/P60 family protein [Smithellaceae bacterium]|nr:NlpC/P60 family protein [Smithellaceae bacterium]